VSEPTSEKLLGALVMGMYLMFICLLALHTYITPWNRCGKDAIKVAPTVIGEEDEE